MPAWIKSIEWMKRCAAALAPQHSLLPARERVRVVIGAALGIFITGFATALMVADDNVLPVLIAPLAASAVLVFVLPASPLAQPWSVIGGNLISAAVGVTCSKFIAPPLLASVVAIAVAIGAMLWLRCVHPPGGAVALTAVLGGPIFRGGGYEVLWSPVFVNSAVMVLAAVFYHRTTGHRYPHHAMPAQPHAAPQIHTRPFTDDDLAAALRESDEILDIDVEDVMLLVQRAERHAAQRK